MKSIVFIYVIQNSSDAQLLCGHCDFHKRSSFVAAEKVIKTRQKRPVAGKPMKSSN